MAHVSSRSALQKLLSAGRSAAPIARGGGVTRGFAAASEAGHHGTAKVNFWEQPSNPGNWKEEQFVILSLTGWGLLIYGGYKAATGGSSKKSKAEK
ncbi:hypothetical protein CBR_g38679 [Chara braunii]|uniref:Uncharacterized protein n=1 Tax=Chara braunii TaxID=69332 RepID=A0A388LQ02_CHABU|nr:hypothetical protein CBR_g38679 [Chara braunii]|eukprot:GBG84397.1 hypothetical protein CBR_g38679 [Chara braunii]